MSLRVTRLGHLGDGIADGPVFVARALPGEVVEGEIEGGRIARPKILTPSADRVAAPCRHYKGCGGCALMHGSDDFVAGWKVDVVRTALAAQGIEAEVRGPATSPPASRRRATFSGRRLKSGPVVGFHGRGADTVTAVPGCILVEPALLAALPVCEAITQRMGSRKGEIRFRVTASEAGIDTDFEGGRATDGADRVALAALAEAHDLARLSVEGEVIVERRPPRQSFDGIGVVPPPGAFLQATAAGEAALRRAVTDVVGGARRIADLFAGCGTFALPLARQAEVLAVEGDPALLAALDTGWRHAKGLKAVRTEARDLFRRPLLPDELSRFDAVVIDPPRAGAEAQTAALAEAQVPRIAAVSCNPVTFARDAALLIGAGYTLDRVEVVDQFRWSPHVELAAAFRANHIPA
ncbi:class I SAM-dependent RNA methyltransferase [Ovoidimarina sediminis]|uniref:class I SAM-dependent RNA methyltransferase n=1 Tax=Ovoidimarina sediminis TaxID=3079856 RepID=UPI00290ACEFC|nr:class I SAM-dependent RNA methyltransferase [Rhodophyticola sp. MJ-SS7]MDU8944528.1 class I SAM-dependent RNA methyltransferase [Rhodophyticola sp. MJ-SS7]